MDIAQVFAKDKKDAFRVVYPPEEADYSEEIQEGAKAMKTGDYARTIEVLSRVVRGSRDYTEAMEMRAVANLLAGDVDEAERVCKASLEDAPDDTRTLATLSAVYLEQGRTEESRALAERLNALPITDSEELYKVATVCCENDLHKEAYDKFCLLEKSLKYDGRMLYFKAVSAFKSGLLKEAIAALTDDCTVYPDAEDA
jgi:tetratricopeptide (TPR) repeat protein